LFVAWVAVLRHQVRRQTEQIREQVEQQARLKADLQRVNKLESLGLLAGGIAHDFNNLLTAVIGNLDLVRHGQAMNPESDESLREAENAASRAKDLTFQLLTFAKGGTPVQAAVLIPELVREVAEFALRGSNSRCQFEIPEGLWPANVDRGQIGQVVQNIMINARQAMPKGGVVDVSIRNEDIDEKSGQLLAPGRYLCLSFTDHGEGIPSENIERIFDPYFTTKKGGVGLGLATVHSIVKKHLGHISVESAPGRGTTFRIWLPAAPNDALSGAARAPAAASRMEVKEARILFMDDDQAILRLSEAILSRIGYKVSIARNGEEAVGEFAHGLVSGRPYSAVILDLTIPGGMGGLQALEEMRKVDPGVRAIVTSGYSNDAVLANYQAHGFRGRLAKPFGPAEIAQVVARVLQDGQT
jgi:nitrogen-specific signal transduction histidine kinase/ActR/RegA family two-component response regulator